MFVHFSKAFDSVNRKFMLHILLNHGVPKETVDVIGIMYNSPTSYVDTMDGPKQEFSTTVGILKGINLEPYLFVLVVDSSLTQSLESSSNKGFTIKHGLSRHHKDKQLTDLD